MMDIVVNPRTQTPIYEQLYNQLTSQIVNGDLKADECLPSIRSLARDLEISIITVKTAYEMLENNGFVYMQPGKGCFVCGREFESLKETKRALAGERLKRELPFYKELGLTKEEYQEIVNELYD